MYLIINNKKIIKLNIADNFFTRIKGLMFKKNIKQGLLINPCNSVHTFFMREKIDVLYIEKNGKIIDMIHQMKPNRIGKINFTARYVIELPSTTLVKNNIKINDMVFFKTD